MNALLRLARSFRPRGGVALAALLVFATLAFGTGLMATSAWLLSTAALRPSIAALGVAVVGVRFFALGRAALRYLERLVSHDVVLRALSRLRAGFFRALVPLLPAERTTLRSGDLLSGFQDDVLSLEDFAPRLAATVAAVLMTWLVAVLVGRRDSTAAAVAVAGLAVAGVLVPPIVLRMARGAGRRAVEQRGSLAARLVDGVRGAAELRAWNQMPQHMILVKTESRVLADAQGRQAAASALGGALVGLLADWTTLVCLALAAGAAQLGTLPGVQIAVVVLVVAAAFEAVSPLPSAWGALEAAATAAARLFALADRAASVREPDTPERLGVIQTIDVRGLTFTYPGEETPALLGVDLTLRPGRLTAIVGPSGAGKSTLISLLLHFFEVPPGSVWVNGVDLRQYEGDQLRGRMAVLAQRELLFTATLRENLLLGRSDAGEGDFADVLARVGLGPWLAAQPDGLDAAVGVGGQRLSGGERQRVALARTLLKDADVLLLDEPTAHVEGPLEAAIYDDLRSLARTHAVLVVTHRLSVLAPEDDVLVLEAGRVVEHGSCGELRANNGRFAELLRRERVSRLLGLEAAP